MHAALWYSYHWMDSSLAWNASDYGDIYSIRLPPSKIWKPDIHLENAKGKEDKVETLVTVYNVGIVQWSPTCNVVVGCTLDLTYFPFDNQTCALKYVSWTYGSSKVNLTSRSDGGFRIYNFNPNQAWKITGVSVQRNVKDLYWDPLIDLTFTMNIVRQTSLFLTVYVGRAIILTLLGAAIFILPTGSGQKITLGCALLICYGIFLLEIRETRPPVHVSIPILDTYYSAIYAMLVVSMFLSVIINNLAGRSYTPPACVQKVIIRGFGRLVCVDETSHIDMVDDEMELCDMKSKDEQKCGHKDWLLVGKVLDRVFLVLYIVLAVIVTLAILIQYYPKYKPELVGI